MITHGFELLREENIAELNTQARFYRHQKTGAELLSLSNDDENKVFGINFRTPPADSTGLPHIMEHSVLGGSRKYRVKEPFVELLKGSLYTFVNAFTGADRTSYPVASTNLQDFYNLIDVYLDAVFYPLITPHHLQQEGWHYELESLDAPLTYKGVVFNEMKGAYSSPDNVLFRYTKQELFPDTPYQHDSGGNPEVIPDLTYEQFKTFHDTYYHPSNALIFFYGDDDPEERLRLLDAYLRDFDRIEVDGNVALQAPFTAPKHVAFSYSMDDGADIAKKSMIDINWVLPEAAEPELVWALNVLSYALVGTQASPLRKALIDSGLGEDLTGSGLSTYLRQMTFSVGLKGIDKADADKVEALVEETLRQIAAEGFEPDMVEAAVNSIEFSLRENNTGSFPRGIALMMRALGTWAYGRDPLAPLQYEAPLTAVKTHIAAHATYLQDLIRTYLLENPHRVTVLLEPDVSLRQRQEEAELARLADVRAALSEAELEAIVENTRELKARQEAADLPEALAAIPVLTLADLDKENKLIPIDVAAVQGADVVYHDLFTNGIVYFDVGLNMKAVPADLLPYVRLFGQTLVKLGTETEDFVKLSQRIGRKTGGIYPTHITSALADREGSMAWLFLRAKATTAQAQDMLDILRDILLTVKLDNQARFRQIVLEGKARSEAGLVPSGHTVVNGRLRAHFDESAWISEQMGGISYLFFLRQLAEDVENDWPGVLAKLEAVRQLLVNRQNLIVNVTVDGENYAQFQPQLADFLAAFPAKPGELLTWQPDFSRQNEGLTIPAQVNYVGKGANLYELGYKLHGSVAVINNYLRTTWLWEKVRVQGGAYGGFCSFDMDSGVYSFLSYRDPNLAQTLSNYDGTAGFLHRLDLSDAELVKSIIGAIGSMDAYQLPDAKGFTSLQRYLIGRTDEARQQYRDEILATTAADFRAFGDVLAQVNQQGLVVVMGSAEAITAVNDDNWLQVTKVL
ncbi:MAG: insulinase family protein [Ardenticatenaceae bacterium]|nr:insulinase family protein [Ardenticatenaceae bacterium]